MDTPTFDEQLLLAISAEELDAIVHCLEQGASPDGDGKPLAATPLMLVGCSENSRFALEAASLLISANADVNAIDHSGDSALTTAALFGHIDLERLLVRNGADIDWIDQKNPDGRTALMIAAERGYKEVADFLIECGADTSIKNQNGETAETLAKAYWRESTSG